MRARWTRQVLSGAVATLLCLLNVHVTAGAIDPEARRFAQTHITNAQWHAFFKETQDKRRAIILDRADVTRIVVPREAAVYFFTRLDHPAHPAVVRRSIVARDKKTYVHTSGYYAGSRAAFTVWMDLFIAQDRKLQLEFKDRGVLRLCYPCFDTR